MRPRTFFALFALLVGATLSGRACNVPVFRYALERWDRDLYQILIVKDGAFTEDEVARAQAMQDGTMAREGFLNAKVSLADVSQTSMRRTVEGIYPEALGLAQPEQATLGLFFPQESGRRELIWQAPFEDAALEEVQESATYEPLIQALVSGASAAFLLLDSGHSAADEAAYALLLEQIAALEQTLEIPEGIIHTDGEVTGGRLTAAEARAEDPANQLKSGIPLKIAFDVVRVAAGDQPVLRALLGHVREGEPEKSDAPTVFPFFGRGRVLPPMVGEMIQADNIEAAARYLCGACSCQMKAQNPGLDSLTAVDWFGYLEGSEVMQSPTVPTLSGFLPGAERGHGEAVGLQAADDTTEAVSLSAPAGAPGGAETFLWKPVMVALSGLLAVLIFGSVWTMRREGVRRPDRDERKKTQIER